MKKAFKGTLKSFVCFISLFFSLQVVLAQLNNNSLMTGTVVTEKGDPLSGVSVKAETISGKESYTTATNDNGIFTYNNLVLGNSYIFTFSYVGYQTSLVKGYTIKPGRMNSLLIK